MANLDPFTVEVARLAVDELREEHHQRADFRAGPIPVLGAECVERQIFDALRLALLNDAPNIVYSGAMTGYAWQAAARGPATIAIHDHCNMLWDRAHLRSIASHRYTYAQQPRSCTCASTTWIWLDFQHLLLFGLTLMIQL